MNPDQKFAEGVYEMISVFLEGIENIKSLEKYYRNNISAIHSIKQIDPQLYNKLINNFKEERHAINTYSIRQDASNKTTRRERQTTPEQEDKTKREERARIYRASHPSAGFWKR